MLETRTGLRPWPAVHGEWLSQGAARAMGTSCTILLSRVHRLGHTRRQNSGTRPCARAEPCDIQENKGSFKTHSPVCQISNLCWPHRWAKEKKRHNTLGHSEALGTSPGPSQEHPATMQPVPRPGSSAQGGFSVPGQGAGWAGVRPKAKEDSKWNLCSGSTISCLLQDKSRQEHPGAPRVPVSQADALALTHPGRWSAAAAG